MGRILSTTSTNFHLVFMGYPLQITFIKISLKDSMSSSGPNTTEEESSTYASQDDILKLEDFDEHEHENEHH